MTRRYRPYSHRGLRGVLAGLKQVLRARGVETRWREGSHHHFTARIGDGEGLEVHVLKGGQHIPRLGRLILIQAVYPRQYNNNSAVQALLPFCDQGNEVLYGSKLYLRRMPPDAPYLQLVIERAVFVGNADLFRIADEFDLLVTEYFMAEEKLDEILPDGMQMSMPFLEQLYDEPVAEKLLNGLDDLQIERIRFSRRLQEWEATGVLYVWGRQMRWLGHSSSPRGPWLADVMGHDSGTLDDILISDLTRASLCAAVRTEVEKVGDYAVDERDKKRWRA